MRTLIYSGAHPVVDVYDEAEGGLIVEGVKRGVPAPFPDAVAVRLLEQDTWSEAGLPVLPDASLAAAAPVPTADTTTAAGAAGSVA